MVSNVFLFISHYHRGANVINYILHIKLLCCSHLHATVAPHKQIITEPHSQHISVWPWSTASSGCVATHRKKIFQYFHNILRLLHIKWLVSNMFLFLSTFLIRTSFGIPTFELRPQWLYLCCRYWSPQITQLFAPGIQVSEETSLKGVISPTTFCNTLICVRYFNVGQAVPFLWSQEIMLNLLSHNKTSLHMQLNAKINSYDCSVVEGSNTGLLFIHFMSELSKAMKKCPLEFSTVY